MSCSNKKIKLDPDIVHGDLQQEEETEKKDGIDIFEHLLLNTSENIELDPEHFSIKAGKEEELMEMGEYTEEVYENPEEIYDGNQALYIKDEAESTFTAVKVPKFMCTICNYATNDPIDFTTHWLSHETKPFTNVNGEYVCQISDCLNVAPSKEAILVHIASQHVYRYRCGLCYYVTFSKKDYDQHRTTHYTYQCVKCNLKSTTLFFVQDHVAAPFKCDICNFTVHHWFPYKKHTNWHQYPADSIVQCELCDFTTGNQALLEKHKAIHFEKSILCKMCRFTGTNATELDNHYRDAHDSTLKAINKLHKCNFCTCKFISVGSKKMHEELHLKNDALLECCPSSKTVQCPYCDHQDIQRNDMISHILSKHAAALELDGFQFENGSDEIMLIYSRSTNLDGCDVRGIDGCKEDQDEHEEQQEANTEYEMIALSVGIAQDRGNDKLVNIQADKTGKMIQRLNDKLDSDRHLISAHTSEGVAQVLTFCCPRCPFTTSNQSLLHSHLLRHCILKSKYYKHESGKTVFSCNSQQTTSNESISTKHELEKEAARYTCSFCYYVAASKEDYDVHCGKHTTFKCSKCSFQATKRLFVEDHIENPWGCSKCDFKTHHWLPMKGHSFRHRDQTFLKCLICSFETTKPSVLASHWLRHTTVLLQCEPSLYKTISEKQQQANYTECHVGTLLDDVSRSTRDRLYECDLCACNFEHEMYLDKHRALHGENGPFHLKCCLCHQSKKITTSEKDRKHGYKPNSWSECPYCSYEDEMRYRMIEHLSNIHEKELEIEGYRFDDDQMEEIIPGRSTSIQNAPVKITSRPSVPQREDKPIDAVEFEMNIEEDIMTSAPAPNPSTSKVDISTSTSSKRYAARCSFCNFTSDQGPEYIWDHIKNEHVQRVFRCNICGCLEKEMHLINQHMQVQHPPLRAPTTDGTKNEMFSCAGCSFLQKKTILSKHMFDKHVTMEELEGNDFSQINPYYFIEKYKIEEHRQMMFKCVICGFTKKELYVIHQHIEEKHPPSTAYVDYSTQEMKFSCPACRYTAKNRGTIRRHMFTHHATRVEVVDTEKAKKAENENVIMTLEDGTDSGHGIHQDKSTKEQQRVEDNDVIIKNETYDAQDSVPSLVDQVVIKVEMTCSPEEESLKDATSGDNLVCSRRGSEHHDRDITQMTDKSELANTFVPIYKESENIKQVQNIIWRCEACPYRTQKEACLRTHVASMHTTNYPTTVSEEIPCKQPGCDFKAPSIDELSAHMARHLQTSIKEVMMYKCDTCSFGTVSKTVFKKHSKTCMRYCCYNCDFKTKSKYGLWYHIKRQHMNNWYNPKKGH